MADVALQIDQDIHGDGRQVEWICRASVTEGFQHLFNRWVTEVGFATDFALSACRVLQSNAPRPQRMVLGEALECVCGVVGTALKLAR